MEIVRHAWLVWWQKKSTSLGNVAETWYAVMSEADARKRVDCC